MTKKRNLDPSLVQWIMNEAGLGPGIGQIKYVAPAASATSQYRTQLEEMGVSSGDIFTTLAAAEAPLTAYRNDIVLVAPGAYLETAELAWDKANTHILGLGGPNHCGDWSEPNVCIYTTGEAVATVINNTAPNSIMQNLTIENYGANAACLSALICDNYGQTYRNVGLHGVMTTQQNSEADAASLYIDGAGMYPIFEDCQIGQDVWGTRDAANSAHLRYNDTGRPNGSTFRRCKFLSRSITATCALVSIPAATGIGRSHYFDNCHFSNFYDGTTLLNQVFYTVTGTQQFTVQLHNCSSAGFAEWQTGDFSIVVSDMPITGLGGGQMRQPTEAVGS
ncbi:MAG: hypothetical protein Q8P24_16985 [Desulfobacterales bacterium]|nr:hypothetical protein [Desulfobacterales bacterium]